MLNVVWSVSDKEPKNAQLCTSYYHFFEILSLYDVYNTLISRNIFNWNESEILLLLHNSATHSVEYTKFLYISRFFERKFRETNFFSKHSVEKLRIYSHWKFFRQTNYLVISLVKPVFSRNFCQKSVREKFRNFHSGM